MEKVQLCNPEEVFAVLGKALTFGVCITEDMVSGYNWLTRDCRFAMSNCFNPKEYKVFISGPEACLFIANPALTLLMA
jgi:hypothetical protein